MLLSLACVDDNGAEYGGEVTFKFKELTAVKKMDKWHHVRNANDERVETRVIVPDCCTILLGREEFDVKANYDELVAKFKEHNEMFP